MNSHQVSDSQVMQRWRTTVLDSSYLKGLAGMAATLFTTILTVPL